MFLDLKLILWKKMISKKMATFWVAFCHTVRHFLFCFIDKSHFFFFNSSVSSTTNFTLENPWLSHNLRVQIFSQFMAKVQNVVLLLCLCFPCHKLVTKLNPNLHLIDKKDFMIGIFDVNFDEILAPIWHEENTNIAPRSVL